MFYYCRKCNFGTYEDPGEHFIQDGRNKSNHGYCTICRKCVNSSVADRHFQRRLNEHSGKHQARRSARKKWGVPSNYTCAVLDCDKSAEELHHVDYAFHESVIPMCSRHHQKLHSLEEFEKHFENDVLDKVPDIILDQAIVTKKDWP